jgi:hypothetical protein
MILCNLTSEFRGKVVDTPASYPGCPELKSWRQYQLFFHDCRTPEKFRLVLRMTAQQFHSFHVSHTKGGTKVTPPNFFSETTAAIIMKFTYIVGRSFTKLRLFFHEISFAIKTRLPHLPETLYAGRLKLFAEALELFVHAVFQLVVVHKTVSSECILQGGQKDGSRRALNQDCREDEREQIQGADLCV